MLRAAADVGATVLFLMALVHMPIGDVFGILQFTPLAITAGAALFLGAKVGWRRWLATVVGLVGVLIIVRPGGRLQSLRAAGARLDPVLGRARPAHARRRASSALPGDRRASAATVTLASLGFLLFESWRWPPPRRC